MQSKQASILHLGKFYPPHNGGIETHLRDLAVRQARCAPVKVIVASSTARGENSVMDGVRVTRVARVCTIASMPVCPGLTEAIRRSPADLVHIHTPNPGAAFAFLRSGHRGKLVITHHADTLGRKALRRLSDPFVREVMRRASAIIATSARYLRTSEELAGFREKCHVIPLGIVPEPPSGRSPHEKPPSDRPIVLAVGRMVPYKGFDVLIRAMKHVHATLCLIGSGPQEAQLRALVASEGVEQKVLLPGRVDDLEKYFRMASLFVLPSTTRAEAFGIAQVEAMAAGLPVINTNIDSGVPEVSVDGVTGLTVEPGDAEGLAGAIERLLADRELRERFGRAGRIRANTEYCADLMTERTLAVYREVLDSA